MCLRMRVGHPTCLLFIPLSKILKKYQKSNQSNFGLFFGTKTYFAVSCPKSAEPLFVGLCGVRCPTAVKSLVFVVFAP